MAAGSRRDWVKKKMTNMGRKVGGPPSAWWKWRRNRGPLSSSSSPSSPGKKTKPCGLRVLFDRIVFSLLYAAEAVYLTVSLCLFYLRFGFRL